MSKDIFNKYNVNGYDEIYEVDINTYIFTDLTDIEIIDNKHSFYNYFNGFTHNLYNNMLIHGFYHIPTKIVKFYVTDSCKIGNALSICWKKYWEHKDENIEDINYNSIYIYENYSGILYKSNDYEMDENTFYKEFIKQLFHKTL